MRFEDLGVDVCQPHIIHGALVSQVSAVLIITHADGSTGSVLILTDEVACIHAFLLQALLYEIAKTVVADHAAEAHFGTQRGCVGGKNSGTATQSQGHLFGEFLLADLRLALYLIENQIYIQFAQGDNIKLLHGV